MKHLIIVLTIGLVTLSGCSTTAEPEATAQQLTLEELTRTPGFTWFVAEMNRFTPNAGLLPGIDSAFSKSPSKKVCIFVKPTCSCRGTQRLFPQVVKTLMEAKVPTSSIEIWSMRTEADRHQYEGMLKISALPAIYVIQDGAVRDSVRDFDFDDSNADTLIARAVRR
ncbi:MAG: hypothetical protein ACKOE4_03620 [Candidatus Kapaibacterium sp.]